jgi:hypothetical protein
MTVASWLSPIEKKTAKAAGWGVVHYCRGILHHVRPITRGVRRAALF